MSHAGLDRPSVWCRDLLGLFRRLLEVDHCETQARRRAPAELAAGAGVT
jgi:hypothetical protein